MAKINPDILQWLLHNTNSQNLYNAVKNFEELSRYMQQGGFKIHAGTFDSAIVQQRLLNLLLQHDELLLLPFLSELSRRRPWRNACRAAKMLDGEYLLKNWRKIIESLADPRMIIMGLYMESKNEALSRLAQRLINCPSLWKNKTEAAAPDKDMTEAWSCLASEARTEKNARATNPEQLKAEQNKNAELRKQIKSYKNEIEQMQRQKLQSQENLELLRRQQEEKLREQEKQWRQECEIQVGMAKNQAEEKHQAALQRLLGYASDEEARLQQNIKQAGSLNQRINTALQRQAEINQRYGLKRRLLQKINRLQLRQEQLRMAINEALVLDDELLELEQECKTKLQTLRDTLTGEPQPLQLDSMPFRIENMIKTVRLDKQECAATLQEIKQFLQQKFWRQILSSAEQSKLHDILEQQNKRHQHILAQNKNNAAGNTASSKEIWHLTQHFADFKRTNIYVDACNLMLRAPEWQEIMKDKGQAETRRLLVEKCKKKVHLFRQIALVFDGVEAMDCIDNIGNNFSLHFAAKKHEEQNADNYLVEMLQKKMRDPKQISWIVTDDYGLRNRLQELCDAAVPAEAFAKFLKM